jgi:endonuclease/exonuclease/phosphatase family metal-dependent hydrolase
MQLISINIWGAKIHDPLISFINKNKEKTDIFLFQEVFKSDRNIITHDSYSNFLQELVELLPDFNYYYSPTAQGSDINGKVDFPLEFGQATFIKKSVNVINEGEIFFYKNFNEIEFYPDGRGDFPRNFIHSEIEENGKKFLVLNVHGFWEPAPKYDTPQRFIQSQKIIDFIKEKKLPSIVAGDFNLGIDTLSLRMLEDSGLRNLIIESKAPTTRSSFYNIKYRIFDKYADYAFVTKGIYVNDFKVMEDEVSDHLPLFLEFEV